MDDEFKNAMRDFMQSQVKTNREIMMSLKTQNKTEKHFAKIGKEVDVLENRINELEKQKALTNKSVGILETVVYKILTVVGFALGAYYFAKDGK